MLKRNALALPLTAAFLCLFTAGAGVAAFSPNISTYLEFPPSQRYVQHAGFSWPVFALYAVLFAGAAAFLLFLNYWRRPPVRATAVRAFPAWGFAALLVLGIGWIAAWSRLDVFRPLQHHTYIVLWYAAIVSLNAVLYRMHGTSPLSAGARYYLSLFPLSAVFWWFYEILNRAVQNWFYVGVESFSAGAYIALATLSFATVLPAVEAVFLILQSRLSHAFSRRVALKFLAGPLVPSVLLALGSASLFFLSLVPDLLFAMLWVSPLLVLWGLERLVRSPSLLDQLIAGDWRETCLWALSALMCGLFWELWNFYSLAKWIYLVPYVPRFHLFEMPLLGYAGYLPFGILCGAVIRRLRLPEKG